MTRLYQLLRLQAELAAAGIVVDRLGYEGEVVFTYDAAGLPIDLPPEAAPVIAAHDPTEIVYAGEQTLTNRVATSGLTPQELFRATLRRLTAYVATVEVVAIDSVNGAMRAITARIAAKRLNNGALLVGTPAVQSNHADAAAATWTVTPSVDGNDFVLTVVGAAGREVSWFVRLKLDSFTPGGQQS